MTPPPSLSTLIPSMLSLSIPPFLSPNLLNQSPSSTCPPSTVQLSPRSPTLRRVACSSAVCTAAETATLSSLYDILGISYAASNDEIKAAYRRLARSCHPDVAGDNLNSAADVFIRVHDAYSTLSDPAKRADYDRRLFIRSPVIGGRFSGLSASNSSGFCSSPRKNWESDQCW